MSAELKSGMKQSVRHLYLAAKALVSAESELNRASGSGSEESAEAEKISKIPQAGVVETNLQAYEAKDWRTYLRTSCKVKALRLDLFIAQCPPRRNGYRLHRSLLSSRT